MDNTDIINLCKQIPSAGMDQSEKILCTFRKLTESVPENPLFVEIGSWKGFSSCLLGSIVKEKKGRIICIDTWEGSPKTRQETEAQEKDIYKEFLKNMKDRDLVGTVVPWKMPSKMAADLVPNKHCDLVFIDANHLYENIKQDLDMWWPKVKQGGILCGHDSQFYWSENPDKHEKMILTEECANKMHAGVITALYEKFGDYHSLISDLHLWWICKGFIPCRFGVIIT